MSEFVLFTDFGRRDPYQAQMAAVLQRSVPDWRVVDLHAEVPAFALELGAYLLPSYVPEFPAGSIFVCVVDPGVGGPRDAVVLRADDRWFVGPDNGLLRVVEARAAKARYWYLETPGAASASFHGRDVFAPAAARLARGWRPEGGGHKGRALPEGWPEELDRVVYADHYGNLMIGRRAETLRPDARIRAGELILSQARTFSDHADGMPFWYVNANGLVELAVYQDSAAHRLGLGPGDPVQVLE
ncbi:MAG: hypothetical protein D6717_03670 [Gammaproteobacteria bacterium]|nr:MAG: hypothetical protein D6717_03670 [Gammaproteobacteria bacterium]